MVVTVAVCCRIPCSLIVSFGADFLQFALVVFFLQSTGVNTLLAQSCGSHDSLQLALMVFFVPVTGTNTALALVQLAPLCGGGTYVCT